MACRVSSPHLAVEYLSKSVSMLREAIDLSSRTGKVGSQAMQYLHLGNMIFDQIMLLDAMDGVFKCSGTEEEGSVLGIRDVEAAAAVGRAGSQGQDNKAEKGQEAEACFEEAVKIAQEHEIHKCSYIKRIALMFRAALAYWGGQEDEGVRLMYEFLSLTVEEGRNQCAECGQMRSDGEAQMLTCSGCYVARFCHAEHQKRAWRHGSFLQQHKLLCPLLGKWRQVVKGKSNKKLSADYCKHDVMTFLQRITDYGTLTCEAHDGEPEAGK